MPPRHYADDAASAAKSARICYENLAMKQLRPAHMWVRSVRSCASAGREAGCARIRIVKPKAGYQGRPAGSVRLGLAWRGAAAPLFRDRIAAECISSAGNTFSGDCFRLKLKEDA